MTVSQYTISKADTFGQGNREHRETLRNLIFVKMLLY